MNIYFERPLRDESVLFMSTNGFHSIRLFFCGENKKIKFLFASLKSQILKILLASSYDIWKKSTYDSEVTRDARKLGGLHRQGIYHTGVRCPECPAGGQHSIPFTR